ncbi:unnamed protein product [Closterium sp. NIES-54]
MTLRLSTAPQRVPLPSPPASSLPAGPDPESDSLRAASPTVSRFLATAVTDPLFESTTASTLVAELVDFVAACRLDFATRLVAESSSASASPRSVGGECALGTDVLEHRQEEIECFAAAVPPLLSMLLAPEGDPDAPDIPTPRSYAEAIEGPYSSQVKRPPGSPPAFKARYVARGFIQRQGVDFFHTFSPTSKMTTLWVLLYVAAQRDYELHSIDFSTAFLQGSLHEEIWLRCPPGFTGSFPAGTQWSLRRPVYGLRQAPREWHDTLRTTLAALGFAPSTADPSLFLRIDTTMPSFYVLVYVDDLVFATADTEALAHVKAQRTITLTQSHMVQQILQRLGFTYSSPQSTPLPTGHSLSAPPSDESVEPSGPYPELLGCLMHRKVHWDAAKRVLRYIGHGARAWRMGSSWTSTPRPPTPSVPLTKLLGRRGLTGMRLLLALATTKASTLRGCTSTNTTATATSDTAAAASTTAAAASTTSTAATEAPTPGTTPNSTAIPSASSTAFAAAPAVPSTTLALAVAASPTRGRRSSDLLIANEVDSSSRSNRGEKGDRGTPLKERGATIAARSTYS